MVPQVPLQGDDDVLELRDYLAVLRRRRTIVILTAVAVVVVALVVSFLQTGVYQASTQVLLQPRTSEQLFSPDAPGSVRVDPSRVATEIGIMESRSVRDAVTDALGEPVQVDIRAEGQTDLVSITAESTDPGEAVRIADTYAETYIETRRQRQVADLQITIDEVQAKITEIGAQLNQVERPLAELDAQIAATDSPLARQNLEAQRDGLQSRVEGLSGDIESQRAPYIAQLDRLQLALNLTQTGGAEIVSRAFEATSPIRPTPARNGVLAAMVGLMLGVGLAFLRDHLDDTVKTKDDLQAATGVTVLGLIPAVATWKDSATAKVVSMTEPKSATAEAYRALRTSVQFIGLENPVKVIQLTSPNAAEGKTTTLANLTVALAGAGQRVVAVCCDLRRPRIHEFLGVPNDVGFTSVLLGEVPLSAALQRAPHLSNVAVLASGPIPPNPSELLASHRTQELFGLLRGECDVLLVDTPPVLPVTDALVVSRFVDATIVVGIASRTTRHEAQRAVELLRQVDAPVVGTVLNGVEPTSVYGSRNSYGYVGAATSDRAASDTAASNGSAGGEDPLGNGDGRGRKARFARKEGPDGDDTADRSTNGRPAKKGKRYARDSGR